MSKKDKHIITGTYRVQLTGEFDFEKCAGIADYLAELGVSDVYCSSYLKAERGSSHGYDVVDHGKFNDELGGEDGYRRFNEALGERGLGQVLDIVANHESIKSKDNERWQEVLRDGRFGRYADYFDINWDPPQERLKGKVLLGVLGGKVEDVVRERELRIEIQGEGLAVIYYENVFPLRWQSCLKIMSDAMEESDAEKYEEQIEELETLVGDVNQVIGNEVRVKTIFEGLLADRKIKEAVEKFLEDLNGQPGRLLEILDEQHYVLSHWKKADRCINYRRFFSINFLAGLRVEDEKVFEYVHGLIGELVRKNNVEGLRVDHVDGLRNPGEYLERLRKLAGDRWIIVEKVLGDAEKLPSSWPVEGSTGYDFLNKLNGLFVYSGAEDDLTEFYGEVTGEWRNYADVLFEKKLLSVRRSFGAEVARLVSLLKEVFRRRGIERYLTVREMREGIELLAAGFNIYRTYFSEGQKDVDDHDREAIERAAKTAEFKRPSASSVVEFLKEVIFERASDIEEEFVLRFQQLTGAVTAKGEEDTAFYCYNRLISLNEVGGEPGRFGLGLDDFHEYCRFNQEYLPGTMLTTSTHDTKRGEDVRMRINLLAEMPGEWKEIVTRWTSENAKYNESGLVDRNAEYFLYQTLVGCWFVDQDRIVNYMIKAVREAKEYTRWKDINGDYEEAVEEFVRGILKDEKFIGELEDFVDKLKYKAWISSLAATLIKYTAPGVPDLYQGTELWDMNLVDPDNRRGVDFEKRKRMLKDLGTMSFEEAFEGLESGVTKMYVIKKALEVRKEFADCFGGKSGYEPVLAEGEKKEYVAAFKRKDVLTVVPRWLVRLGDDWGDTNIDIGKDSWKNVFTGKAISGRVRMCELFGEFPAALLCRERK